MSPGVYERLRPRASLSLELGGRPVVDDVLASLLLLVDRLGSLRRAARALGLGYASAWERIRQAESVLGVRLVEARRGGRRGGGAGLTVEARELLAVYEKWHRRLLGRPFEPVAVSGDSGADRCLVLAGSHDPLLELAVGEVGGWEPAWTGSLGGAALVMLGEADAAGIHLPGGNERVYRLLPLGGRAVLIPGYRRSIGLASRGPVDDEARLAREALEGGLVVASRQPGSGSQLLLEEWLRSWADRMGLPWGLSRVRWAGPYRTHHELASAIATGRADIGVVIEAVAAAQGLHYRRLAWERYDLLARPGAAGEARRLVEAARRAASRLPGYEAQP